MAKGWKYLLCDSSDMSPIGELIKARGRSVNYDFNGSGQASSAITVYDELFSYVKPWKTCIAAVEDDVWKWSGPITQRNTDGASAAVTLPAVGWFDKLMHLFLKSKMPFTNQDAGAIVSDLIDVARAQYASFALDLRITMGANEATQPRTITYERDQNIGQAIIDLCELESGFDWYIDPVTRQLNIVARRGVDRPHCKWLFIADGEGADFSNLKNYTETIDGTTMVNEITPRGKFSFGYATDTDSMFDYDIIMSEVPSLSEIGDSDVLNAYANEEIVYRSTPPVSYTIFPKTAVDPSVRLGEIGYVPKIGEDFDLGDTTRLTIRHGGLEVTDQAERIFGADLTIDDGSNLATINNLQTRAGAAAG